MGLLEDAVKEKIYDTRQIEKNIRIGVVSKKELDSYLGSLPDDETQAKWVQVGTEEDPSS